MLSTDRVRFDRFELQPLEACTEVVDHAEVGARERAAWWAERARQMLIGRRPEARAAALHARKLYRALGDAHGEFIATVAAVRASGAAPDELRAQCAELQALHDAHPAWRPVSSRLLAGTLAVACGRLDDLQGQLEHRLEELALAHSAGRRATIDSAESNVIATLHDLGRHAEVRALAPRALALLDEGSPDA